MLGTILHKRLIRYDLDLRKYTGGTRVTKLRFRLKAALDFRGTVLGTCASQQEPRPVYEVLGNLAATGMCGLCLLHTDGSILRIICLRTLHYVSHVNLYLRHRTKLLEIFIRISKILRPYQVLQSDPRTGTL